MMRELEIRPAKFGEWHVQELAKTELTALSK
jgi:hypothetical protein